MVRRLGCALLLALFGGGLTAHGAAPPPLAREAPAPYAVFPSSGAIPASEPEIAAAVIRARAALDRPPAPLPRLHTEGTLPGHGIRDASIAAKRDHPIALDLALAWRVTGERPFLKQAMAYLLAWVDTYQPSHNPIDETGFDALILATDLIAGAAPPSDLRRIDAFWRRMAAGYLDAMAAGPRNANTNWQSHRIKLATLAAFRVGDARLIARARDAYRKQITVNLNPDGSTYDFAERDALHYVVYNFDPLLTTVLAARAHGQDWYRYTAPSGASLPRSLAWLAAFARGERTHLEFANSRIAFDRERAAAGQREFAPHPWDPAAAIQTYALAALLDPTFVPLRDSLVRAGSKSPAAWIVAAEYFTSTNSVTAR